MARLPRWWAGGRRETIDAAAAAALRDTAATHSEDLLLFLTPGAHAAKSRRRPLLASPSSGLRRRRGRGAGSNLGAASGSSSLCDVLVRYAARLMFGGGLVHRITLAALAVWTMGTVAFILSGAGGEPDEIVPRRGGGAGEVTGSNPGGGASGRGAWTGAWKTAGGARGGTDGTTYPARVGLHMVCTGVDACECDDGWGGEGCAEPRCNGGAVVGSNPAGVVAASGVRVDGCVHGKCLSPPFCTCEEGYTGGLCEAVVCRVPCERGVCTNPEFCACDAGYFGAACDAECVHGAFSVTTQNCTCEEGWFGEGCKMARCESGCVHGDCVAPDVCLCHSGFELVDCSVDAVKVHAAELVDGLRIRLAPRLGSLTVSQSADETVRAAAAEWSARGQKKGAEGEEGPEAPLGPWLPPSDALASRMAQRFHSCAMVGNSGGLLATEVGDVVNEHEVVLRLDGAPTRGFEKHVGSRTTFRLASQTTVEALLADPTHSTRVLGGGGGGRLKEEVTDGLGADGWGRSGKPGVLMWQPKSYRSYRELRRVLPSETALLLSPEFLFPALATYDTLGKRLTESGMAWNGRQASPDALVGVLFLLQVCTNVNVYGVDPPTDDGTRGGGERADGIAGSVTERDGSGGVKVPWRPKYYSRAKETNPPGFEPRERDVEYGVLRVLHARRLITLCPTEHAARCAQMTPRNARGVIVRSGVKW